MAKCNLRVVLEEPERIYQPGDKVRGIVHVDVDADVNCKALEITCGWQTHGKGNVSAGVSESVTAYEGSWSAGEKQQYAFELAVAAWPPTYHGTYLNITHSIDARAKIAWAFDPKASSAFQVHTNQAPEELTGTSKTKEVTGPLGCFLIASVVALIAIPAVCMMMNPVTGLVVGVLASGAGIWFFIKQVMPILLLGKVKIDLDSIRVSPGSELSGHVLFHPRKPVEINALILELVGREVCISGSGSNRKTHTHELIRQTVRIKDALRIVPGQNNTHAVHATMPATEAFSCDLGDNKIVWSAHFRVDVPRWPDYRQTIDLEMVPTPIASSPGEFASESTSATSPSAGSIDEPAPASTNDITFVETARHLHTLRNDRDQVSAVVEAVTGMTFPLEAHVERRLLYSGDDDPHVYEDGYAVWARYTDPPLGMVLYVPHDLADEFEQTGRDLWRGTGTIVGWDRDHRRLQIKLISP